MTQAEVRNPRTPLAVGVKDGAALLGVSAQTIRKLIREGNLKTRRIGVRVVIPWVELERFLEGKR